MPAREPTVRAVAMLSPVSMTGVTPSDFRSATAWAEDGLMVSATAQIAITRSLLARSVSTASHPDQELTTSKGHVHGAHSLKAKL